MWKRIRRMSCLLLAAIILTVLPPNLSRGASSVPAVDSIKGSIEIALTDLGTAMEGCGFALYQVAVLSQDSGYVFNPAYSNSGVNLNGLQTADDLIRAIAVLEPLAQTGTEQATAVTDAGGKTRFDELDSGVYLIMQKEQAAYGVVKSMLIFLPQLHEDEFEYDVIAHPKAEHFERDFQLYKVDILDQPLPGVEFTLQKPDGTVTKLISDSDGKAKDSVKPGQYILREEKVPEDYIIISPDIRFEITTDYKIVLADSIDGQVSVVENELALKVVNREIPPSGYLESETDPPTDTETDESEETETKQPATQKDNPLDRRSSGGKTGDRMFTLVLIFGALAVISAAVAAVVWKKQK